MIITENHHSINSQPGKSRSRNDSTLNPLQRVCAWSDSDDESRPLLMDADVTQVDISMTRLLHEDRHLLIGAFSL